MRPGPAPSSRGPQLPQPPSSRGPPAPAAPRPTVGQKTAAMPGLAQAFLWGAYSFTSHRGLGGGEGGIVTEGHGLCRVAPSVQQGPDLLCLCGPSMCLSLAPPRTHAPSW